MSSLRAERRLNTRDLQQVVLARHAESSTLSPHPLTLLPAVPMATAACSRWLCHRQVTMLREDAVRCRPDQGLETIAMLELFERVTQ
jgi:hypothetical protein